MTAKEAYGKLYRGVLRELTSGLMMNWWGLQTREGRRAL
jgi:hypothetical protein